MSETPDPFMVLTIVAGLALAVERMVEAVKHIIESTGSSSRVETLEQISSAAWQAMKEARDAVKQARSGEAADFTSLSSGAASSESMASESGQDLDSSQDAPRAALTHVGGIDVLPATPLPVDKSRRILIYQLLSAGLGILLADLFDVHLFFAFFEGLHPPIGQTFADAQLMDEFLSGLIIGGGSQPVHLVLSYLTQARSNMTGIAKGQGSGS